MICGQCRLINPSDNLFCQNCGTTLEVPERLASPMFTKANTMDNNSILLTRNHWLVRWDLCLPFVLVAMVNHANANQARPVMDALIDWTAAKKSP